MSAVHSLPSLLVFVLTLICSVMKFGKEFADKMHFGVANKNEMASLLPTSGLPETDSSNKNPKPVVIILDSDDKKFVMPELFR